MADLRQLRSLTFGLSVGAATSALVLAIAFVMTVVASPAAHAQTYKVIYTFTGGGDGGNPAAGVTLDGAGNLYGTTVSGGTGYGTVFRLKRSGSNWLLTPLHSFTAGLDGAYPEARVIFGPEGILYGTTDGDLSEGYGTVFSLRPSVKACKTVLCPWTETVLYRFAGNPDGALPGYGDLVFDKTGNIYGTTLYGGGGCSGNGCGTVFELSPPGGGWTESILYRFSGPDGQNPSNGLIFDPAGNLYSTTLLGGVEFGTVFELTYVAESGWTESLPHNFGNGADGSYLYAGLIFDQSGNLYGATSNGGSSGGGTVFQLSPSDGGWTLNTLYNFSGGGGCGPYGTLVMDEAGNLYGTTFCDGASHAGSVFKLMNTSSGWAYTSLHDFTGQSDGYNPKSNVILDANGNLYGTAQLGGLAHGCGGGGCGVVWEITP